MKDVTEFLKEKGALDLIFQLSKSSLGFNELKKVISGSPNTLLLRLKESARLGLIEETLVKTGKRPLIKYRLTKEGKIVVGELSGIEKKYSEIKKQINEAEETKKKKEKELRQILPGPKKIVVKNIRAEKDVNIRLNQ